jgi:glycosyltransferase involved in cell wall biosynthesis
MILIDSVYINNSGGKTLLEYFINQILESDRYIFLIDVRLTSSSVNLIKNKIYVNPSEKSRKIAYKQAMILFDIDTIFCFANVPPPFKIHKISVVIFLHNALLLKNSLACYTYINRLKFQLKRVYIKFLNFNSYQWVVQTNTMKNALLSSVKISKKNIHVIPFFQPNSPLSEKPSSNFDKYIYVADAVPQKNHKLLLESWEILSNKYNLCPELVLTINYKTKSPILKQIENLKCKGINITNIGVISSDLMLNKYEEFDFLIFPSLLESFGLPLIEACEKNCKIIASDLDYVYDIVVPSIVFNPFNADELAKIIFDISSKNINIKNSKLIVNNGILDLINLLNNQNV